MLATRMVSGEESPFPPPPAAFAALPGSEGSTRPWELKGKMVGSGVTGHGGAGHTLANRISHSHPHLPQCFAHLLSAAPDPWSQPQPSGDGAGQVWEGQLTSV